MAAKRGGQVPRPRPRPRPVARQAAQPTSLEPPQLDVEPQEINLGILTVGDGPPASSCTWKTRACGCCTAPSPATTATGWPSATPPAPRRSIFQFGHELTHARPRLRRAPARRQQAAGRPAGRRVQRRHRHGDRPGRGAGQAVPDGVLAGATTPAAGRREGQGQPQGGRRPLRERRRSPTWYKANGWTYPVQGPPASGLGAVQQFFEALGLTPPPKVDISDKSITLAGDRRRPPSATSSRSRRRRSGRSTPTAPATSPGWRSAGPSSTAASPPSRCRCRPCPNRPGETLTAKRDGPVQRQPALRRPGDAAGRSAASLQLRRAGAGPRRGAGRRRGRRR